MPNLAWGFSGPGRILFGRGARGQLPDVVQRRGWKSLFLVTDRGVAAAGLVQPLAIELQAAGCSVTVFDSVEPEPSTETAQVAATVAAAQRPDAVIAVGGGSVIDVAKMLSTLVTHGGNPQAYFGFDKIPGPILPLVALPTTAGTGSEASHSSVLTDRAAGLKVSTLSPYLRPQLAIIDPELTDSCPARVTADSGIDALVHAIEAFTARDWTAMGNVSQEAKAYEGSHPLGRLIAGEAARLIDRHLATAVRDGRDHAARDALALAACYAGMAFSNCGVALVHALEYPLGTIVHCSHGAGNGLLLPYVMRFNLRAAELRFAELARVLGCNQTDERQQAQWLIDRAFSLRREIGIPDRLRDLGTKREHLETIARKASQIERLMTLNPRPATYDDLLEILQAAY